MFMRMKGQRAWWEQSRDSGEWKQKNHLSLSLTLRINDAEVDNGAEVCVGL
jgi:hypothetical protein